MIPHHFTDTYTYTWIILSIPIPIPDPEIWYYTGIVPGIGIGIEIRYNTSGIKNITGPDPIGVRKWYLQTFNPIYRETKKNILFTMSFLQPCSAWGPVMFLYPWYSTSLVYLYQYLRRYTTGSVPIFKWRYSTGTVHVKLGRDTGTLLSIFGKNLLLWCSTLISVTTLGTVPVGRWPSVFSKVTGWARGLVWW